MTTSEQTVPINTSRSFVVESRTGRVTAAGWLTCGKSSKSANLSSTKSPAVPSIGGQFRVTFIAPLWVCARAYLSTSSWKYDPLLGGAIRTNCVSFCEIENWKVINESNTFSSHQCPTVKCCDKKATKNRTPPRCR